MKSLKTWRTYPNSGTATNTWNYDGYRGFLTNKTFADGKGPNYTYSPGGRFLTRTWARGIVTTYTNNNAGEVIGIGYSDGATTNLVFGLDRLGKRTNIVDGAGTRILAYNDAGLLLSETNSSGPFSGLTLSYSYDALLGACRT